jgi:hypothetical protein
VSSLKERGRSIPGRRSSGWCAVPAVSAGSRQPAGGVRVERPQRSEDERPWGRQGLTQDGQGGSGSLVEGLLSAGCRGGRQLHRQQPLAVGSPRLGCRSSARRAMAASSCAAAAGGLNQAGDHAARAGVMTHASTRRPRARAVHVASCGAGARQRTWPSRRPSETRVSSLRAAATRGDAGAASVGDAVEVGGLLAASGEPLGGLDRGPAHQPGALFGGRAAAHGGVGLVLRGGGPGPGAQLRRGGEAVHVADLGHEGAPPAPGPPRGWPGWRGRRRRRPARWRSPARASWPPGRRRPAASAARRSAARRRVQGGARPAAWCRPPRTGRSSAPARPAWRARHGPGPLRPLRSATSLAR